LNKNLSDTRGKKKKKNSEEFWRRKRILKKKNLNYWVCHGGVLSLEDLECMGWGGVFEEES
jgi:hypothetical protein